MDPSFQSTGLQEGVCVFCDSPKESEEKYGKFLRHEASGINAHYYCLLFACGLSQRGETSEGLEGFLIEDILTERKRAQKLKCKYCKKKGASVGCSVRACHQVYHYGCGVQEYAIYLFYDSFVSYCVKHRPVQNVLPSCCSPSKGTCPICIEKVQTEPGHDVLKTPCCKGTWLHRECVQLQALSAGYFFRCPICNNENEFQDEMKKFGIYLPEKDAEWEYGRDAYQDLYERHSRCDVDQCRCPKGRKYSTQSGQWEIVLCDLCGSAGCHMACGGLITSLDDWACKACTSLFTKELHQDESSQGKVEKKPSTTATPENRGGARARSAIRSHGKRPRAPLATPRLVKKQRFTTPLCPPLSPVTGTHRPAPTDSPISTPHATIKFPKVSLSPTYLPDELRPGSSGIYVNRYKEMIPKLDCYVTLKHSRECADYDMSMPLLSPVESAGGSCKNKCGSKVKCKRARKLDLESCDHSPSATVTDLPLALEDSFDSESKGPEESRTIAAASTSTGYESLEQKSPVKLSWGSRLFGSVGSFLSWGKSQTAEDTQKTVRAHNVDQEKVCKDLSEQDQQTQGEAREKAPQTSSRSVKHSYEYHSPPPPLPSEVKAKILPVEEDQLSCKKRNLLEGLTSWKDNETWIEAKEDLAQLFQLDGRATRSALKKGENEPAKPIVHHTPKVKKKKKKDAHPLSSVSVATGGLKKSRKRIKRLTAKKKSCANKNSMSSPGTLLSQNLESSSYTKIQTNMKDSSSTSVSNTGKDVANSQSTSSSSMSNLPDNLVDERLPEGVKAAILPISPSKLSKKAAQKLNTLTSWKDDETWKEAKGDLANLFQVDGRATRSAVQSGANAEKLSNLEERMTCTTSGTDKPSAELTDKVQGNALPVSPQKLHNQTTKLSLQDTPKKTKQAEMPKANGNQHTSSTAPQLLSTHVGQLQDADVERREVSDKLLEKEKANILPIFQQNLSKQAKHELNTLTSWKDDLIWKEAKGELSQLLQVEGRTTRSVLQNEKDPCKSGSPSRSPKKGEDVKTSRTNMLNASPQKSSKESQHLMTPNALNIISSKGGDTCKHPQKDEASILPNSPHKLPKQIVSEVSKLTSWKDDKTWKEAKVELAQLLQVDGRATRRSLLSDKDPCKTENSPRTPKKEENFRTSRKNLPDTSSQKSSKESKHLLKANVSLPVTHVDGEDTSERQEKEKADDLPNSPNKPPKQIVNEVSKLTSWKDDKIWKEAKTELAELLQVDGRATRSVLQKERGLTPNKIELTEGSVQQMPVKSPKMSDTLGPTANDKTIDNNIQPQSTVTAMKVCHNNQESKRHIFTVDSGNLCPANEFKVKEKTDKYLKKKKKKKKKKNGNKGSKDGSGEPNKRSKKDNESRRPKAKDTVIPIKGLSESLSICIIPRELPRKQEQTPTKSNDQQSRVDQLKCSSSPVTPSSATKRQGKRYSCSHMRQPGTPPIHVNPGFRARQSPQVSGTSLTQGSPRVHSPLNMISKEKDTQHRNTKGVKRRLENDGTSQVTKHKKQEDITAYFSPLQTSGRVAEEKPSNVSQQSRKRPVASSSDVKQGNIVEKQSSISGIKEGCISAERQGPQPSKSYNSSPNAEASERKKNKIGRPRKHCTKKGIDLPQKHRKLTSKGTSCDMNIGSPRKKKGDSGQPDKIRGHVLKGKSDRSKTKVDREQLGKIRELVLQGESSKRKIGRPRKTEADGERRNRSRELKLIPKIRELPLNGESGERKIGRPRKTEADGERQNKFRSLSLKGESGERKIGRPRKTEGDRKQPNKIRELLLKGESGERKIGRPRKIGGDRECQNKIRELTLNGELGRRKVGRPRKSEGDSHKVGLTGIYRDKSSTTRNYLAKRRTHRDLCGFQHGRRNKSKGQLLIARSMFIKKERKKHMISEVKPLKRRMPESCMDQSTQTTGDLAEVERYIESKGLLYQEPVRIPPFKRRSMATTAIARTQTYNLKYGNRCRVLQPSKLKSDANSDKNIHVFTVAEPCSSQPNINLRPKETDQMVVMEQSVQEPISVQDEKICQVQQAAVNVLMRSAWIGSISTSVCDQSTETTSDLAEVERYDESKCILYKESEILPDVKKSNASTAIGTAQTWNLKYGNPERMSVPSALSKGQNLGTKSGVCTEVPSMEEQDGKSLVDKCLLGNASTVDPQGDAKPVKQKRQTKQEPYLPSSPIKANWSFDCHQSDQPPPSPRRSARTNQLDQAVQTDSSFREVKGHLASSKRYFEDQDPARDKPHKGDVKQTQTLYHMKSRRKEGRKLDQKHLIAPEAGTNDESKHLLMKQNIEDESNVNENGLKLKGGSPQDSMKRPKPHDWFRIKPKK